MKKSKFQNKFDCVFLSSRSAQFLQDPLSNTILRSSPAKSLVAVETSKYITSLLRDQKAQFIEKEKEFGTLHNWTYLSTGYYYYYSSFTLFYFTLFLLYSLFLLF